ncbi:hypothetical protein OR1_01431 [Geobacter sp. OR-1]|uniref:hypothetical protein n=1 Tax=Geobacter sp. OR-1 TaxID=1266765 RepID=UPI00054310F3|nr:hypothetical protein [Geobacter sp. OR-1]GAM09157.1 hypothetical protein OR1_01431 [Geobacter sp. OR-1]
MRLTAYIIALSLLCVSLAWAAPPKPRPLAGIGVLTLTTKGTLQDGSSPLLSLYREPGVGRMTDLDPADFPSMTPAIKGSPGMINIAFTRKRGDWVKVIFDDSGREGWLALGHGMRFKSWKRYLQGGEVRLLNGLKKDFYQLRPQPSAAAKPVAAVSKEKRLRVVELDDSWILVLVDLENSGWLRWKDDDGRLLISVEH